MTNNTTTPGRWRTVMIPSLISAVLAVALWEALPQILSPAQAQITPKNSPLNAIKDRRDVIVEIQDTNKKLDALMALLKSGKMRVIAEVELKQPAPTPRRARD
ncbi:MAG: hypothetical protein JW849_10280 [Phycisphaerae bacterium]|nr:hypothetical protein [Phycisphaerae bacterium]